MKNTRRLKNDDDRRWRRPWSRALAFICHSNTCQLAFEMKNVHEIANAKWERRKSDSGEWMRENRNTFATKGSESVCIHPLAITYTFCHLPRLVGWASRTIYRIAICLRAHRVHRISFSQFSCSLLWSRDANVCYRAERMWRGLYVLSMSISPLPPKLPHTTSSFHHGSRILTNPPYQHRRHRHCRRRPTTLLYSRALFGDRFSICCCGCAPPATTISVLCNA